MHWSATDGEPALSTLPVAVKSIIRLRAVKGNGWGGVSPRTSPESPWKSRTLARNDVVCGCGISAVSGGEKGEVADPAEMDDRGTERSGGEKMMGE